jgi:hypothetical protein
MFTMLPAIQRVYHDIINNTRSENQRQTVWFRFLFFVLIYIVAYTVLYTHVLYFAMFG